MMTEASPVVWIVLAVVAVLLLAGWLYARQRRSGKLREAFGDDEYSRTVVAEGGRSAAEADLLDRRRRAAEIEVGPIGPADRARLEQAWPQAKARFVDSPSGAVADGDRLIEGALGAAGYPEGDTARRHGDLTVRNPALADPYREARIIADRADAETTTTEELRRAMVQYGQVLDGLFAERGAAGGDNVATRPAQPID